MELVSPNGTVVRENSIHGDEYEGFEYQARMRGTYILRFQSDEDDEWLGNYAFIVENDCPNDIRTACRLRPGRAKDQSFAGADDSDLFEVPLKAQRLYQVQLSTGDGRGIEIVSSTGAVLATTSDPELTYRPITKGTYYVRVLSGLHMAGADYTVVLRLIQ
jgi:hypothetical protein